MLSPDQRDYAARLLRKAAEDLAAVRALLDNDSISDDVIGFHAQQTVEKAMKSALVIHGVAFRPGCGGTLISMAHQIRLNLDHESAARLATLAERAHAQQDDLAVTLLAEALAEIEREPGDMAAVLDRVPGSWERMQLGREQAGRGETVGLDEL